MVILAISFFRLSTKFNINAIYIGLFFLWFILGRIARLYAKFVVGYEYGFFEFTGILLTLAIIYTITTYIGLFFIYFYIERAIIKKTHYFFSILVIIVTVLSIINYQVPETMVLLAPLYVVVLLGLPLIFINLARQTQGSVRKNALSVAIGILCFEFGIAFDVPEAASIWINVPGLPLITQIASPILQIIGCILIWKGFPKDY